MRLRTKLFVLAILGAAISCADSSRSTARAKDSLAASSPLEQAIFGIADVVARREGLDVRQLEKLHELARAIVRSDPSSGELERVTESMRGDSVLVQAALRFVRIVSDSMLGREPEPFSPPQSQTPSPKTSLKAREDVSWFRVTWMSLP